jgi:peptidoglycan/xylan/chitin deacetylase (PgdA/CDA1 family)
VSLVVPYYHMVSDTAVPHVSPLYRFRTISEFRSDIEFFLNSFEPITLRDIVEVLNGQKTLSRPSFHLTFDDGFREMYDIVAPILQGAGVPATFFLNTAFVDGGGLAHHNALSLLLNRVQSCPPLTEPRLRRVESLLPAADHNGASQPARLLSLKYGQQALIRSLAEALEVDLDQYVREVRPYLSSGQVASLLARGFSIGAHSHDHPRYADLQLPQQLSQTRTSVQWLDSRFGLNPRAFAFPHNDSGVENAFFAEVFSEPLLDVSFGTGGLVQHFHPRNIERVSMEKTAAPASQVLGRQFARAAYFRLRG